jgi:hypothetical protein
MVSSYKTVDDSPSPWAGGEGRGEGERLFNCTVPAKNNLSRLERILSPKEIAEGKKRASDWLEQHRQGTIP